MDIVLGAVLCALGLSLLGPLFSRSEPRPLCPPCQCQCECVRETSGGHFGLATELFLLLALLGSLATIAWLQFCKLREGSLGASGHTKGGKKGVFGASSALAIKS